MKKKLLALAVAASIAPMGAYAVDSATVSGFADIWYIAADDELGGVCTEGSDECAEGKFDISGEVDFSLTKGAVTARLDIDVNPDASESGAIEQAMFSWAATESVTIIAGAFNNPIGWELEDAPDMYQFSHGQIWDILDGQTALTGNNIAGIAAAVGFGMGSVTLGFLNDLQQTDDENSIAAIINLSPMEGLDLELGYVTQAGQDDSANGGTYSALGDVGSAEDVVDFNVTYTTGGITAAFEYLTADQIIDSAFALYGNYNFGNGFGATLRYDVVSYGGDAVLAGGVTDLDGADVDDTETLTIAVSYAISDNLGAVLEWRTQDDPNQDDGLTVIGDGDVIALEFVAQF